MLHIVIPAYNEQERLPRTLRVLRRYLDSRRGSLGPVTVTVVDNASDDATAELALRASTRTMPVRVVRCPVRGKGAAVRAGLLATGDDEIVCFMDADGATDLAALHAALAAVAAGADVVIGSRALDASVTESRHCRSRSAGAAAYRRLASRLAPGLTDTQCGFKMLRGDLARRIARRLDATGFSFDVELLVRARAAGAVIEEIPVVWADVPGSTFVPARDGAGAFWELARIAWRTRGIAPARPLAPAVDRVAPSRGGSSVPLPVAVPAAVAAVLVPLAVPMDMRPESDA